MAQKREERVLEICRDITRETDQVRFAELVFDLGQQLEDIYGKKEPESSTIHITNGRRS
jgi:hypothetical protein